MSRALLLAAALAIGAGCTRTTELIAASTCVAPGPLVSLGGADAGASACAGAVAAQAARYALCSCNDVVLTGNLIVNPPLGRQIPSSSSQSPWPGGHPVDGLLPASFFAAIGTDQNWQVLGRADVPGTLVVAGTGDAQFGRPSHVLGNARFAGALLPSSALWISGDAFAGGDVTGGVAVGGTLHVPAGAAVAPTVAAQAVAREPVATVAPPCDCETGHTLDIATAVFARRTNNANVFLPVSADVLDDVTTPLSRDWPCGEYYLDTLRSEVGGALELLVHGHVGIFVAGDVRLYDTFTVTLDEGATLDLVVAGSFYTTAQVFGAQTAPARVRLWVGSSTVSLPAHSQFGAFVYAPGAVFSAGADLTFSGSLFVGKLSVDGDVHIDYDPALTQAGAECGVAAPAAVE
ncbi:MAG TPA: hypothetical protein VK989_01300 [Polyangia bacterium]|nr:hypothetical protein [Polyangia bacterium]